MNLLKRFRNAIRVKGYARDGSMLWAIRYFPESQRDHAARVAQILKAQLNVNFDELTPMTRIVADLHFHDLEPVEVLMALEQEFGFTFSKHAFEHLDEPTIADIIGYCLTHAKA